MVVNMNEENNNQTPVDTVTLCVVVAGATIFAMAAIALVTMRIAQGFNP